MATSPASGPGTLSAAPSGAAGGDLSGTYPNPAVAALAITDAKVAAANKDGAAGTASMRTLGATGVTAAAGNDSRLSDSRAPSGAAGGDLTGTYPNPTIGASKVTTADLATAALDREAILLNALGILTEAGDVSGFEGSSAMTSGFIYASGVGLRNGDVVTNILANVTTAATGAAPTLIRQGIADSTGKILAVTADSKASAVWTTAGLASVALAPALTITADGLYYLVMIMVGTFGGTALALRKAAGVSSSGQVAGKPFRIAIQTGQTDLPAVNSSMTLVSTGQPPVWQACN